MKAIREVKRDEELGREVQEGEDAGCWWAPAEAAGPLFQFKCLLFPLFSYLSWLGFYSLGIETGHRPTCH